MTLEQVLNIAGWFMTLAPVTLFFFTSLYVIRGLAKEDDLIMAVVFLSGAVFAIGLSVLSLLHFTNILV